MARLRAVDVRMVRTELGLTQAELGRLLDAGESSVRRWEMIGVTGTPAVMLRLLIGKPHLVKRLRRIADDAEKAARDDGRPYPLDVVPPGAKPARPRA